MPSSITWLDFSESERRKVLEVVELFRDQGTVDELGIGTIRDGFADLFFPGTSTLLTRAGYLLFVPWIYQEVEQSVAKSRDPWRSVRQLEVALIDALADSEDGAGTIGINSRAALKRFPSELYWGPLGTYGIRRYRGSQDQLHRWLSGGAGRQLAAIVDDEGEPVADGRIWHATPRPPDGFPRAVSFRLRPEDAAYLRERIAIKARDAVGREGLLAYMLAERITGQGHEGPWALDVPSTPDYLRGQLDHAGRFSLAINGAPLLYNLMLARKSQNAERQEFFEARLGSWAAEVEDAGLDDWDRAAFWRVVDETPAQVHPLLKRFVDGWLDLTLSDPGSLASGERAHHLILGREREVKGSRARLVNPEALRLWGGDSGTDRLTYRWDNATRIIADILESVPEDGDA